MSTRPIVLKKVRVHNLKGVDLTLPAHKFIVFTGVSGSGKSSLAFDTLFAEGQRRYVESLSTYARRQISEMAKPDIDFASGITPTISIEQKTQTKNPRSTVGTLTEIYDYLRVLYARIGIPHCPISGKPVQAQSKERIIAEIQLLPLKTKVWFLAPFAKEKKGEFKEEFQDLLRRGYTRVRVDGQIVSLEEEISLDGSLAHTVDIIIDRIVIDKESAARISESVIQALQVGFGVFSLLFPDSQEEKLYSLHAFSPESGLSYDSLEPHDFSFNSPSGMCPRCNGLGSIEEFDLNKIIDPNKSIAEDACSIASSYQTVRYGNIYNFLAEQYHFNIHAPWKKLPEAAKKVFLYGVDKKWLRIPFIHPETGAVWIDHIQWQGVLKEAHKRYTEAKSDSYKKRMLNLMTTSVCPDCHGSRLRDYPSAAQLSGKSIHDITRMSVQEAFDFFNKLKLTPQENFIAEELLKEIHSRLKFLLDVGLHYLALERTAPTLSGGEGQRVRLASQIGCGLVGITYILDEPSIGLHPRDNERLISSLLRLRDMQNTVIAVEHDEETILAADHVVDIGPGPGVKGGEIVFSGSVQGLLENKESTTAAYLRGDKKIAIPKKRRKEKQGTITVVGAVHHNLKNITVKIPLKRFIAITGVSGSGKSSLILDTLYPALANNLHKAELFVGNHKKIEGIDNVDKVIAIDQSPIGRNPRSNPATYIKLFDPIRDLFSQLPEARAKGFKPGQFSFNVKEGSCTTCGGMGMVKVDMDFLEDAWVPCPSCESKRFDEETLSILYKGKSIADVLSMEVAEALNFFDHIPQIRQKLEILHRVGLDYLQLGQPSTTLSGGEAQRIKLAKELLRPATGKTIYLLDEPTTGLHFSDIKQLLDVLHELVDRGNTVVVIEHNMDLIKTADWVIEIGPEGGALGGKLVAEGTPEEIARLSTPTSEALKRALSHSPKILSVPQIPKDEVSSINSIEIKDAAQNNLKNLNVSIPREKITICTGPSGSGKSSFAFDTVYAEGQRRYTESLSPYARQFVKQMQKPKVASIDGLSPAIAIEQKAHAGNPRSTVGTMTEIYDYLRVLFAHLGVPHNPATGIALKSLSIEDVVQDLFKQKPGTKIQILAPIEVKRGDTPEEIITRLKKQGFLRVRLNGAVFHFEDLEKDLSSLNYDRKRKNSWEIVVDRVVIEEKSLSRIRDSLAQAAFLGKNSLIILKEENEIHFYLSFADPTTGETFPPITPKTFAFNVPEGFCPDCQGLGTQYGSHIASREEVSHLTPVQLIKLLTGLTSSPLIKALQNFFKKEKIDPDVPLEFLTPPQLQLLMEGSSEKEIVLPTGGSFSWLGIDRALALAIRGGPRELKDVLEPLMESHTCPTCSGERINKLARHVTINELSLPTVCRLSLSDLLDFINSLSAAVKKTPFLADILKELKQRLGFLIEIGLHYISLERAAPTLSGGETQRIRLARQLGSGLTGVLYVVDEPTIGLHPKDTQRLNSALKNLKTLGNTLLIVEHDPETIALADHVIDFGPASGDAGGYITAEGTLKELLKNPKSLTGSYLSGKKSIPRATHRRDTDKGWLEIKRAKKHNLKNIDASIPIGCFTAITGVSGSGKSTLIHDVLAPMLIATLQGKDPAGLELGELKGAQNFDKLLVIDQNPIGHTVRSDVGTYVDALTKIREFYAALPQAKMSGLQPKHFSYNHLKGMCTNCWGLGYKKVEMLFLPPVKVPCDVCHGLRLNPLSLTVQYGGMNFGELLKLTVDLARKKFENMSRITRSLDTLISVGLGYLKLGQEMATLSGGEAQRIKLSRELAKRSTGNTLYLLDEPTTGLHSEDIVKLLAVLNRLVDKGNTVVVIEHHLDVIASADHVLDLGPEAGPKGGELVAVGTPEEISKVKASHTGRFLLPLLK